MVALASPEELQRWLEWAGQCLLSLGGSGAGPQGYKVAWPIYAPDSKVAYGYSGERLRPPKLSSRDIRLMDEILLFPEFISEVQTKRIVGARSLVTPVSGRYLYSWSKIAFMLHLDRDTVKRRHSRGLAEIIGRLPEEKVYAVRQSLPAR